MPHTPDHVFNLFTNAGVISAPQSEIQSALQSDGGNLTDDQRAIVRAVRPTPNVFSPQTPTAPPSPNSPSSNVPLLQTQTDAASRINNFLSSIGSAPAVPAPHPNPNALPVGTNLGSDPNLSGNLGSGLQTFGSILTGAPNPSPTAGIAQGLGLFQPGATGAGTDLQREQQLKLEAERTAREQQAQRLGSILGRAKQNAPKDRFGNFVRAFDINRKFSPIGR